MACSETCWIASTWMRKSFSATRSQKPSSWDATKNFHDFAFESGDLIASSKVRFFNRSVFLEDLQRERLHAVAENSQFKSQSGFFKIDFVTVCKWSSLLIDYTASCWNGIRVVVRPFTKDAWVLAWSARKDLWAATDRSTSWKACRHCCYGG